MSLRPYYAVTHIASQILNRYLSVNLPRNSLNFEFNSHLVEETGTGIESWGRYEWTWFLRKEINEPTGLIPWLTKYLRFDDDGLHLLDKLESHLKWCRDSQAIYLLLCDPFYPAILREIPQAPIGLSILGNKDILKTPKISVVGSRKTANLVLEEAHRLGYLLARFGFTVVSGGAYGCDIATHEGVLRSGQKPLPAIVVFANGLQKLYPQGNREAFLKIIQNGGILLSERLYDQSPKPYDFPIRNRIISGLSMWTLVMGAHKQSGAMITARLALDQGREVSVFLPKDDSYFCEGCQILVDDGAKYFVSANDFCKNSIIL